MNGLFERRVILVTGKGGVGRTTLTAALARAAAANGKRVLVSEVEELSRQGHCPLAEMFGAHNLHTDPIRLTENIQGVQLQAETGAARFLTKLFKVEALSKLALRTNVLLRIMQAGPSLHEMGVFYHLLSLLEERHENGEYRHELILIDMPATGHTLALTELPQILARLVSRGPVAEALRQGQAILNNPKTGTACVVTIPEPLPVSESLELIDGLKKTGMDVGAILVNRFPTVEFSPEEAAAILAFDGIRERTGFSEFSRNQRAHSSLERLQANTHVPITIVPESHTTPGDLVGILAEHLSEVQP